MYSDLWKGESLLKQSSVAQLLAFRVGEEWTDMRQEVQALQVFLCRHVFAVATLWILYILLMPCSQPKLFLVLDWWMEDTENEQTTNSSGSGSVEEAGERIHTEPLEERPEDPGTLAATGIGRKRIAKPTGSYENRSLY